MKKMDFKTGRHRSAALISAILGVATWAVPALAQPSQSQINAVRQNCRSDYMAHCSSVAPGGADSLHCLQQNSSRLSSSCRGAVDALKPPAQPAAAPAAPPPAQPAATPASAPPAKPAAKPSPAAQPQPAAKPATRQAAQPQKAAQPRQAAPPPTAEPAVWPPYQPLPPLSIRARLAIVRVCDADRQAHCSMVPLGQARMVECLARNEPVLSQTCQQALASARASGGR